MGAQVSRLTLGRPAIFPFFLGRRLRAGSRHGLRLGRVVSV